MITDGEDRAVLAACRSLAGAGYAVGVVASSSPAASHWSRSCAERLRATSPRIDAARFIDDLSALLARRSYATLIVGTDTSLLAISRGRARLEQLTRLGLPPHEVVERCLQRDALAAATAGTDLAGAAAVRCRSLPEALAAARDLGLPALVKAPATVRVVGDTIQPDADSIAVADERALAAAIPANGEEFLVQQMLQGEPHSFGGVAADGRLIAVALSRYRRTWPPHAGNAAFSETVALPPELERDVERLVANLGWEGLFEVELMRTADGRFVPFDFNPRPYGSMALAGAAGASLTAIWCDWLLADQDALRRKGVVRARPGRLYRWEDADLRHLVWQLRRGHYRAATATARPRRGVVHPHFQLADPAPLLARVLQLVGRRLGSRRGRLSDTRSTPNKARR